MANRRMFHKDIITTDRFISMSPSSQALYFHLSMCADDEGFIGGVYRVTRSLNFRKSDLTRLIEEKYIKVFDSGVGYICDWTKHNHIRKDRFNPSIFINEKLMAGVITFGGD